MNKDLKLSIQIKLSFEIMLSSLCFRGVNIDLYLHNLSTVAEKSFKGKKLQRRDDCEWNMNKSEKNIFGLLWCWYTVLSVTAVIRRSLQGSDFLSTHLLVVQIILGIAAIASMIGKFFNLCFYFVIAAVKIRRQIG